MDGAPGKKVKIIAEILVLEDGTEMEIRERTGIREMANLREIAMNVVSGVTDHLSVRIKVIIITAGTAEGIITEEAEKGKLVH